MLKSTLAANWWVLVLRGLAAIAFGVFALAVPKITLMIVVGLFAAYTFVGGLLTLFAALRGERVERRQWWALVLEGVAGIAVAVMAIVWPKMTLLLLVYLIAWWAIVTGILDVVAAVRLRKEIRGEWFLLMAGILSIVLGVFVFANPGVGARALAAWIGIYAVAFGALMTLLGLRLRSWGLPTHASGHHQAARP